ncbi:CRISPR-associated ring nuclease Crn3/Csx3 [Phormidesmis priestleyi]
MAKPIFEISQVTTNGIEFRLVKFEIPGGVTTPEQFANAIAEIEVQLTGTLPILLNGRGPVWGYGMLFHAAHPTPAIAAYDPRLGYVVTQTHDERFRVGQVIQDSEIHAYE